jgi:iron complex outermembrane receptor protein
MRLGQFSRGALLAAAATSGFCLPNTVLAQEARQEFNIAPMSLGDALLTVGRQADVEVIFPSDAVTGRQAEPLRGTYSIKEAITRLLAGTNLIADYKDGGYIIRGRSVPEGATSLDPTASKDTAIIVTGTRIRGSKPASPVIIATRDEIVRRGFSDLGQYIRDLPQNYNGGQNPGIVGSAQGGSEDLNSSSSLNLRGLGADATLTLINGHRVAYDGVRQGVDISAIPLAAIDRLEIVADGASALYGSDAVGGVANVILRKSYDGLWTSMRVGFTTNGGGTEQQFSAVTGTNWTGGGILLTADYKHTTPITAAQRPYADTLHDSATLIPGVNQFSSVVSGFHEFTDGVRLEIDGQYSRRKSFRSSPYSVASDARFYGATFESVVETFSVTPTLRLPLSGSWELAVTGTYGEDGTIGDSVSYRNGRIASTRRVPYHNSIKSVEAYAEGSVLPLPGGDVRLVFGAGARSTSLDVQTSETVGTVTSQLYSFNKQHKVRYGFAEVSLPIVSQANAVPFVGELRATAALRYEDYGKIGDVASPKLGLVYSPDPNVAFKFSWGKSFKAPTLFDQYRGYQALLLPPVYFGTSAAPAGSMIVYTGGANVNLREERATTWTATASITPRFAPGSKVEISYFNVRYNGRVANPIPSLLGALSNPLYEHLIRLSPTADEIDALAAGSLLGLENFTDGPYDPTNVYALIEGVLQNTARQKTTGVDIAANYVIEVGSQDHLALRGAATYLKSARQLLEGGATAQLAGIIFNPPHWRVQGGLSWDRSELSLSAFGNYIDGTLDNRLQPHVRVGSFLSFDLVGQWKSHASTGPLRGASLLVSVGNLFDERPSRTRSRSITDPSYDSTNYPATGRTINFTITKAW